jgi:hypothetical protein
VISEFSSQLKARLLHLDLLQQPGVVLICVVRLRQSRKNCLQLIILVIHVHDLAALMRMYPRQQPALVVVLQLERMSLGRRVVLVLHEPKRRLQTERVDVTAWRREALQRSMLVVLQQVVGPAWRGDFERKVRVDVLEGEQQRRVVGVLDLGQSTRLVGIRLDQITPRPLADASVTVVLDLDVCVVARLGSEGRRPQALVVVHDEQLRVALVVRADGDDLVVLVVLDVQHGLAVDLQLLRHRRRLLLLRAVLAPLHHVAPFEAVHELVLQLDLLPRWYRVRFAQQLVAVADDGVRCRLDGGRDARGRLSRGSARVVDRHSRDSVADALHDLALLDGERVVALVVLVHGDERTLVAEVEVERDDLAAGYDDGRDATELVVVVEEGATRGVETGL